MTNQPALDRIARRDRGEILIVALAEQQRLVDGWQGRVHNAKNREEAGSYASKRDEANRVWGEIRAWLDESWTPENISLVLAYAGASSRKAREAWQREDALSNDNPQAIRYFALIMLDRMLQERFGTPAEERAAA